MERQRDVHKSKQRASPPIAPVQQDFLFVDAANAKSSRKGRRNARSFVMQKARKERPWSTSKRVTQQRKSPEGFSPTVAGPRTPDLAHSPITSTPSPPFTQTEAGYFLSINPNRHMIVRQEVCSGCQVLRCQSGQHLCPRCLIMRAQTPPEDLDNSLFDPFRTVSIEINGQVSILLDHFVTDMAPTAIVIDIQKKSDLMRSEWFSTAMKNSGFMHSLLCTAALHQFYSGRGTFEAILYHRVEAVTAINSALSNLTIDDGISDANIGAVFNLMTLEETLVHIDRTRLGNEQTDQRKVHYEGLRRMIQMRGGLLALGSNRILQAFILWHSTAHAIATFDVPYLSTDDLISVACNPRHPLRYKSSISQHLLDCCRVVRVTETLTTIVQSVLILIADLNALFDDAHSLLDPVDIQNYVCVLECLLLQWLRDHKNVASPLEDALCVALLIFTVRTTEAFRAQADTHPFHYAAIRKLERALNATSRSEWQTCPDLLLYILAIGAVSAEGSTESSWFVKQASLACLEYSIHDADMLLDRLHFCGWVSFKLGEAVRLLWERILEIRLEPSFDGNDMVGPLQVQVASPDFTDWQNIDWSSLVPLSHDDIPFGGFQASSSMEGDDFLYDFITGNALPHGNPIYMR